ncbi:MAG: cytidylate kinase-like family protein [Prevotella sp.]|nr:cytidylate kinase-like family protein [Prevotella sp.]
MQNSNQRLLICVGRQIGSGGRVIAKKLAEEFGCKFMDSEILNLAAKESGFSEKFFEQNDEHKGFFHTLLNSHGRSMAMGSFYKSQFSEESLFQFQADAISKAAKDYSCVFVGRCADYVLRDEPNMISIFITADLSERVARAMERHQCDETAARKIIENGESQRATYYNYYTGKRWGHADGYDLCVNTSRLGIEKTAQFVADFIKERMKDF